jgi:hypothetical protein
MFQRVRSASFLSFASILAFTIGARSQCATQWRPGPPLAGCDLTVIAAVEWDPDGVGPRIPVVVLGGGFTAAGDVPANHVVAFDPATSTWSTLGSGVGGASGFAAIRVFALAVLPNGDLVAGGAFTTAGGVPASCIARWDGTAWSPLGGGLGPVDALAETANGDLLAGANNSPSSVMRWNGSAWSAVGSLTGGATALVELPSGDIVAGGHGLVSNGVVLHHIGGWNGTAWLPLGGGIVAANLADIPVQGLLALPGGDVIAAGNFVTAGGVPARGAARWDGTTWTPLATVSTGFPQSVARAPNGDLVLSGVSRMDDVVSEGFARSTTTCPATATASGPGCDGDTLAATSLPWTGAVFRARASGLPATGIALDVLGFITVSIPLVALLPQGGVACALAVSPDSVAALVPIGGVVTTQLVIPNSVVFAGVVVHEQVLTLGLGAGGAITTFTGTNRLTLTIGSY